MTPKLSKKKWSIEEVEKEIVTYAGLRLGPCIKIEDRYPEKRCSPCCCCTQGLHVQGPRISSCTSCTCRTQLHVLHAALCFGCTAPWTHSAMFLIFDNCLENKSEINIAFSMYNIMNLNCINLLIKLLEMVNYSKVILLKKNLNLSTNSAQLRHWNLIILFEKC